VLNKNNNNPKQNLEFRVFGQNDGGFSGRVLIYRRAYRGIILYFICVSGLLGTIVLGGLHLLGKLAHHVLVDDRIEIAAQHIDEPPVPDVQFSGERATDLHWNHAVAGVQKAWPEFRHEDNAATARDKCKTSSIKT